MEPNSNPFNIQDDFNFLVSEEECFAFPSFQKFPSSEIANFPLGEDNCPLNNFFQESVIQVMNEKFIVSEGTLIIENPIIEKEKSDSNEINKEIIEEIGKVKIIEKIPEEKSCFPFNEGKGLKQTLENLGLIVDSDDKKMKISQYKEKKFDTKILIKDPNNGKLKKMKKRRKFKPDNIRKKIKSRFHKDLKLRLNKILKESGSEKLFDLFPQNFITNITIKSNREALSTTFGDLIEHECYDVFGENEKTPNKKKFNRNKEVMKYILENDDIRKRTEFDKIVNMTYEKLLKAYFSSAEFEKNLIELYNKNKKEKIDYFEDYVNRTINYIQFYKNTKDKNSKKKIGNDDYEDSNN